MRYLKKLLIAATLMAAFSPTMAVTDDAANSVKEVNILDIIVFACSDYPDCAIYPSYLTEDEEK